MINETISATLTIREMAESEAINASFWYTYDELIKQCNEKIQNINDWKSNPLAALLAWITIITQK